MCSRLSAQMRERRLRFGDRVICPFLRPFFLDAADEARVRGVAEMLWTLGERVALAGARPSPQMLADLALQRCRDPSWRGSIRATRRPARRRAPMPSSCPDSLQFAEHNAESPAGAGYSQAAGGAVRRRAGDGARSASGSTRASRARSKRCSTRCVASYREWGGTASPPRMAIVDWREVPTYSEFEILRDAFTARGVPTMICDPRDLEFAAGSAILAPAPARGLYAKGERIDLVYRRVLINDIVARPSRVPRACSSAYRSGTVCVANSLRCKIPHKKAFFAVLTDQRYETLFSADERAMIRRHVPWTALVEERRASAWTGGSVDLMPHLRAQRDQFVIKPNDEMRRHRRHARMGDQRRRLGYGDRARHRRARCADGWLSAGFAVRREMFPICDTSVAGASENPVAMRDMLVDFAPYIFRGRLAGVS